MKIEKLKNKDFCDSWRRHKFPHPSMSEFPTYSFSAVQKNRITATLSQPTGNSRQLPAKRAAA